MKNVVLFIIFIIYTTGIFFLPNNFLYLLIVLAINLLIILINKIELNGAVKNIIFLLPFILFTGVLNVILENYIYAFYITFKLILVCNITYSYSKGTTTYEVARTVKKLCSFLKIFKINVDDIEVLVAVSLSMIPVFRKELLELKNACLAKNIEWKLKNMKTILSKFLFTMIKRVNDIDEALYEKGHI